MTTIGALDLGAEFILYGLKMASCKSSGLKRLQSLAR